MYMIVQIPILFLHYLMIEDKSLFYNMLDTKSYRIKIIKIGTKQLV